MIKQGKTIIIGLSSIIAVAAGAKMVSFPDEKLSTDSLQGESKIRKPSSFSADSNTKNLLAKNSGKNQFLNPKRKELINKIIRNGLSRIGTPYIYGGTTEKGFDCSGFVQYAFKKFNINVPRSSTELAEVGKKVK